MQTLKTPQTHLDNMYFVCGSLCSAKGKSKMSSNHVSDIVDELQYLLFRVHLATFCQTAFEMSYSVIAAGALSVLLSLKTKLPPSSSEALVTLQITTQFMFWSFSRCPCTFPTKKTHSILVFWSTECNRKNKSSIERPKKGRKGHTLADQKVVL